jgi:hypothetical protein
MQQANESRFLCVLCVLSWPFQLLFRFIKTFQPALAIAGAAAWDKPRSRYRLKPAHPPALCFGAAGAGCYERNKKAPNFFGAS